MMFFNQEGFLGRFVLMLSRFSPTIDNTKLKERGFLNDVMTKHVLVIFEQSAFDGATCNVQNCRYTGAIYYLSRFSNS